jgi:hypothetical protein
MKKLKLKGVKWFDQGHPAGKGKTTMQISKVPLCSALNNEATCKSTVLEMVANLLGSSEDNWNLHVLLRENAFLNVKVFVAG